MQKPEDLPNYQHLDYQQMVEPLTTLLDVYGGLEGVRRTYLKKEPKEPSAAYELRLERSTFNNKMRPIIEANAGLLSAFDLADLPPSIEAAKDNLDQRGCDYKAFFQEADTIALRDGHCYVMVDYPEATGEIVTAADQMASPRRPYLVLIDRRNLLNWRSRFEQGRLVIEQVTIQMQEEVPAGKFGMELKTRYHQLKRVETGDGWRVEHEVWEINAVKGEDQVVSLGRSLTTLSEIPLVCYPYTGKMFNTDIPPFLKLARLNIKLFRKESCLDEIEYRVNVPTVYRKHPTPAVDTTAPPVVLGANFVLEIPLGGEVGVLELSGSGIAALQSSVNALLHEIEAEGLGFLAGGRVQRTATEAFLSSSQIQASLSGMARHKSSAVQRIFEIWCEYTGEAPTLNVSMDTSLLETPLDATELSALLGYWQQGAISHETLLNLMVQGKQLPSGFDIQEEMEKIQAERSRQMAAQQPSLEELMGMAKPQNGGADGLAVQQ